MCETFNAVIKEARDKPVLTMMEWLRRYLMKRNYEKWQGVQSYEGKNMPYIKKTFDGMEEESRKCVLQISREDMYEVSHRGDQLKVDLALWTCTCYHWQLTGIPCVHAFRCILEKNADPNDYVDSAYSRETYLHAYSQAINPMPGVNYWKKIDLPHPLPPVHKIMPGRPNLKKRKKEKGEEAEQKAKKVKMAKCKCSNCGQVGHNKRGCKATTVSANTKEVGRPPSTSQWAVAERSKKSMRAKNKKVFI
ncbi:uncharacterized protein LOC130591330 [Beta vulgaris subsp. vulgaris]|uniref:uncharacterized protein LOC130591330 n=1 Tax=Beta vulgaris subsp. vulgaris TaxID=3555 RepID=UPI0025483064|nr:uncharacterized protein LOC130591330 [Beta vulgaris subsp. vulgaris]